MRRLDRLDTKWKAAMFLPLEPADATGPWIEFGTLRKPLRELIRVGECLPHTLDLGAELQRSRDNSAHVESSSSRWVFKRARRRSHAAA